jgi:TPR repeat protein
MRDGVAAGRRGAAILCLVLGLALGLAVPPRAEVRDGVEAYRNGDFQAALQEFRDGAQAGDMRAQYNLGVMLLKGAGIARDAQAALDWYRRSAEQGYAAAQHGLGVMYYRGNGVAEDHEQAAKWFVKAAEQDFAQAQLNLGVMYFTGRGVPKDGAEVVKWITLAAAKGLAEAQYRLGAMYDKGMIFRADRIEAARWYEKAAEQGHEKGGVRLAALAAARIAETSPAAGIAATSPAAGSEPAASRPAPVETSAETETETEAGRTEADAPVRSLIRVQLASFRSPMEAELAWRRLRKKHGGTLDGLTPEYVEADLGPERGIYHRLTAGPLDSLAAARALCHDIQQRAPRQGCFPVTR